MLVLRDLTKSFAPNAGLHSLNLEVPAGDRLVVLGPSGSGKSTLLRLICGLDVPDHGSIHWNGRSLAGVPPHERNFVFVPQRPALYPHLRIRDQLEHQDDLLGIAHLLGRYPHQLSGGERQRVAIARALGRAFTRRSALIVFDEPFAALDPVFRSEIRHDLHLLLRGLAATMVLVTHDPIDAMALGRRVGVLGDGRLQQLGTPEELANRPGNRFVAFALGRLSFIDGRVCGGDSSEPRFVSEDGSVEATVPPAILRDLATSSTPNLTLGIRPEDVLPRPVGTPLPPGARFHDWSIVSAEPVGSGWLLTSARGSNRIRVGWLSNAPPRVGPNENWFVPVDRCLWFDHTGRCIR